MGAKSKSANIRSAAGKRAAKAPARRRAASALDRWEQSAQVPDERIDEIDCQRMVQNEGGRSLPLFYDDYN